LDNVDKVDECHWLENKERKAKGEPQGKEWHLDPVSVQSFARSKFKVTAEAAALSFDNLVRLGLIEVRRLPEEEFPGYHERDVTVGEYGRCFLLATTKEPNYWRKQFHGKREEFAKRTDEWHAKRAEAKRHGQPQTPATI
jgi:hypothetical protein